MNQNDKLPEAEPMPLIGFLALAVCAVGVPVALGVALLYLVMGA